MVMFEMLYEMILTFKLGDETVVCDHSNDSYQAVLSCDTDYASGEYKVVQKL